MRLYFALRDSFDFLVSHLDEFGLREIEVRVGEEGWHVFFFALIVVGLNCKACLVLDLHCIDLWVGVHVCEDLVLAFYAAKLEAALDCTLSEDVARRRESAH